MAPAGGYKRFKDLGLEESTVGVWLQDAGYRTGYFGKYLNGYPAGLGEKHVPAGWDDWQSPSAGSPYSSYDYTLNVNGTLEEHGSDPKDYITDVLRDRVNAFIKTSAAAKTPFFVHLATYAPHGPANYAEAVAFVRRSYDLH